MNKLAVIAEDLMTTYVVLWGIGAALLFDVLSLSCLFSLIACLFTPACLAGLTPGATLISIALFIGYGIANSISIVSDLSKFNLRDYTVVASIFSTVIGGIIAFFTYPFFNNLAHNPAWLIFCGFLVIIAGICALGFKEDKYTLHTVVHKYLKS